MKLILASQSPRRKELLAGLHLPFEVVPSHFDESTVVAAIPRLEVQALAAGKAWETAKGHPDAIVIGADTVVALDEKILGKPKSPAEAKQMLRMLSGRTHDVFTGVCVVCRGKEVSECAVTHVTFRELSPEDIEEYVQTGSPFDKAGAYGIQDCDFVRHYEGEYENVMGLPLCTVKKLLTSVGVKL